MPDVTLKLLTHFKSTHQPITRLNHNRSHGLWNPTSVSWRARAMTASRAAAELGCDGLAPPMGVDAADPPMDDPPKDPPTCPVPSSVSSEMCEAIDDAAADISAMM